MATTATTTSTSTTSVLGIQDKDRIVKLLHESILHLCKVSAAGPGQTEVDGIVCITQDDGSQIVVKVHEKFGNIHSKDDEKEQQGSAQKRRNAEDGGRRESLTPKRLRFENERRGSGDMRSPGVSPRDLGKRTEMSVDLTRDDSDPRKRRNQGKSEFIDLTSGPMIRGRGMNQAGMRLSISNVRSLNRSPGGQGYAVRGQGGRFPAMANMRGQRGVFPVRGGMYPGSRGRPPMYMQQRMTPPQRMSLQQVQQMATYRQQSPGSGAVHPISGPIPHGSVQNTAANVAGPVGQNSPQSTLAGPQPSDPQLMALSGTAAAVAVAGNNQPGNETVHPASENSNQNLSPMSGSPQPLVIRPDRCTSVMQVPPDLSQEIATESHQGETNSSMSNPPSNVPESPAGTATGPEELSPEDPEEEEASAPGTPDAVPLPDADETSQPAPTTESSTDADHPVSGQPREGGYRCGYKNCSFIGSTRQNLEMHCLTHISGISQSPFRCAETGCDYATVTKQYLQTHFRITHSSRAAVKLCPHCIVGHTKKDVMERHRLVCRGENLPCEICGANQPDKLSYASHLAQHYTPEEQSRRPSTNQDPSVASQQQREGTQLPHPSPSGRSSSQSSHGGKDGNSTPSAPATPRDLAPTTMPTLLPEIPDISDSNLFQLSDPLDQKDSLDLLQAQFGHSTSSSSIQSTNGTPTATWGTNLQPEGNVIGQITPMERGSTPATFQYSPGTSTNAQQWGSSGNQYPAGQQQSGSQAWNNAQNQTGNVAQGQMAWQFTTQAGDSGAQPGADAQAVQSGQGQNPGEYNPNWQDIQPKELLHDI